MLEFRNQSDLIEEAVQLVCHKDHPCSVLFLIPPCFGEAELARALEDALSRQMPRPAIARIDADQLETLGSYLERLHQGWDAADVTPPPVDCTSAEFEKYLGQLPRNRPFVQILARFHKILDHLDPFILGSLRTAEQDRSIRSIVLAPYDYDDVKRHWSQHAEKLTISNYGDKHKVLMAEPMEPDAIEQAVAKDGIPRHVLEFAIEESGGIPELFNELVHHAAGIAGAWTPARRKDLIRHVRKLVRHVVDHLDPPGDRSVRRAVANIHLNADVAESRSIIERHPWSTVLLGRGQLRSFLVGRVAVDRLVEDEPDTRFATGRTAYAARRWREAEAILAAVQTKPAQLLREHAGIMALLGADAGVAGIDADWQRLPRAIANAREIARTLAINDAVLTARYGELELFARTMYAVIQRGATRLVDALAGLDSRVEPDPTNALLLLLAECEFARRAQGDHDAVQRALALPEQILRVFAFWHLGLRDDAAPASGEIETAAWVDVAGVWRGSPPAPPAEGTKFGTFLVFALFVGAMALRRAIPSAPWPNLKALERDLSLLDVRRDGAHAVSYVPAKKRREYFDLIDRWMATLFEPSSVLKERRDRWELLAMLDPLPAVSSAGELEWP